MGDPPHYPSSDFLFVARLKLLPLAFSFSSRRIENLLSNENLLVVESSPSNFVIEYNIENDSRPEYSTSRKTSHSLRFSLKV